MPRTLDCRILSVMERALDQFGANISRVVFFKFEKETGLTPQEIFPKNLEKFTYCLSSIFGLGYPLVEIRIASELRKEFGLPESPDEKTSFDLARLLKEVRNTVISTEIIA